MQMQKGFYYKGLHSFILRQFNARVNTAWVSISLVCAMLFVAVCGLGTGFSLVDSMNASFSKLKTYDVSVSINPGSERSYTPGPADSYDYLSVVQKLDPEWDKNYQKCLPGRYILCSK